MVLLHPCSLGREQGLSSVGMQLLPSAASSWISSVQAPVSVGECCAIILLLNHLTAIIRLPEEGKGLRNRPVEYVILGL